jgi:hypothetical protein
MLCITILYIIIIVIMIKWINKTWKLKRIYFKYYRIIYFMVSEIHANYLLLLMLLLGRTGS